MPEPGAADGVETLRQAAQRGHSAHLAPEEVSQVLGRLDAAEGASGTLAREHDRQLDMAAALLAHAEDHARDASDRAEHAEQVAGELYEAARAVVEGMFDDDGEGRFYTDVELPASVAPACMAFVPAKSAARVRRLREALARQGDQTSEPASSLEVGGDVASGVGAPPPAGSQNRSAGGAR